MTRPIGSWGRHTLRAGEDVREVDPDEVARSGLAEVRAKRPVEIRVRAVSAYVYAGALTVSVSRLDYSVRDDRSFELYVADQATSAVHDSPKFWHLSTLRSPRYSVRFPLDLDLRLPRKRWEPRTYFPGARQSFHRFGDAECSGWDYQFRVPFWLLDPVLGGVMIALVWGPVGRWIRGRVSPGRCRNCGYDVRYSPGRCPECGVETVRG